MTSTVSFKDKLKQIFSVVLWDLKGCKSSMLVYSILSAVATVIIFTLVMVLTGEKATFATIAINDSVVSDVPISQRIQVFQAAASAIIGLLTLIFTIIYTVQIFSYMHNKRKVDFYGSLPISRARLFLAKSFAAYLFSIVPMLVFMGIIAIISICTGTFMLPQVTQMYINFIVGTLACVSAYGFLAACCGTTFNTIVMFIAVCACYPLSMAFVRSYIDAFFTGAYTGDFFGSFIPNALNPISAYLGNNLIYWLIFSFACIVFGTLLNMKRRSERAQTSFAYYIPCHIIKVIVSFLTGMFLGTMFGSFSVLESPIAGFIFGFILASAPTFLIVHMLFYKGLNQLVKTIPIYAGLAVVVVACVSLISFDVFGYNNYVPNADDVKSAGYISSNHNATNKKIANLYKKSAEDFTDANSIDTVVNVHKAIISNGKIDKIATESRYRCVWGSMFYNVFREFDNDSIYTVAYKLNNGSTVTRYYSDTMISMAESMTDDSVDTYDTDYDYVDLSSIDHTAYPILSSKAYVLKYSGLANVDANSNFRVYATTVTGLANANSEDILGSSTVSNYDENYIGGTFGGYYTYEDETSKSQKDTQKEEANRIIMNEINQALKKDLEADDKYLNGVLYDPFAVRYYDLYTASSYNEDSVENLDILKYIRKNYSKDYVCEIFMSYTNSNSDDESNMLFSSSTVENEYYFIPKTYTNTLEVLRKYGLINENSTINKNSEFYSGSSSNLNGYNDYSDYYDYYEQ